MQEGVSDLNGIKRTISRNYFGSCEKILAIKENAMALIMMQKLTILCGDKVHIYLKLDKDKNISRLKF